jgi:ribonuclease HI
MPEILNGIPWGFFDGASQGYPPLCGVGIVLFISKDDFFNVRYVPSRGTNMKGELSAMWNLLFYANIMNMRKVWVFGDSKVAIDWGNNKVQI